ncbi:cytochrome bd oxidase small subunit CydS [Ornithinibacillus contaminans]
MDSFLLFIAPFLVIIAAIAVSFWAVLKDGVVSEEE